MYRLFAHHRAVQSRRPQSRAFTLIELIIVVVILAVLATIAIPTFTQDIKNSVLAKEATTLNSLGTDALSIARSQGETLPTAADFATAAGEITLAAYTAQSAQPILTATGTHYTFVTTTQASPVPSTSYGTVSLDTTDSTTAVGLATQSTTGGCVLTEVTESHVYDWSYSTNLGSNCNGDVALSGPSQAAPSTAVLTYDQQVASLAPSAWWKLNDAVGSTTAIDSSGNGYTGTVNGGVTFGQTGPITGTPSDTAALFDGSTGYISTGFKPTFSAITILVWVNAIPTSFGSNTRVLAAGGAGGSGFDFYVQNGVGIYIEQGGTEYPSYGSWLRNPGSGWEMWTLTWDGATVKGYYQGVQQFSQAAAPGAITCANALTLGAYYPGFDFFPGAISEVAIFPTALTASQISSLYAAGK